MNWWWVGSCSNPVGAGRIMCVRSQAHQLSIPPCRLWNIGCCGLSHGRRHRDRSSGGDVFDIPPGHDNWVIGDEPAVAIVWGGWRGFGKRPVGERILTTMVMTDIVGSTDRAAAVGDAAWDQLLERHHIVVREVLERHRGTEINTTGDGFLTTFDGAARAVQAAIDIRDAIKRIGLDIRAGVHTGEVEVVPGGIRGLAVHETARIMALGGAGEILLSDTTRAISASSAFTYEDHGVHQRKEFPSHDTYSCSPGPQAPTQGSALETLDHDS